MLYLKLFNFLTYCLFLLLFKEIKQKVVQQIVNQISTKKLLYFHYLNWKIETN